MIPTGHRPRLDDVGTPEAAWAEWLAARLPEMPLPRCHRAVVVAPHPDDEVLAAGGLMQRLATAGTELMVVSVSDGEASHPHSPTVTPLALADRRVRELRQALAFLGIGRTPVLRLALPDGAVAAHTDELISALGGVLGPNVLCVAPWHRDGHPDHDAAGVAAATACAATGAPFLGSLVWTWHWSRPGDPRVPWAQGRQLTLSPIEATRKRWAIRAFRSQIAPLSRRVGDEAILAPETLAYFDRTFEVFVV